MNGSVTPEDEIDQILADLRRNRPNNMADLNRTLLTLRQKLIRIPQQRATYYKERMFDIMWFQAYTARNVRMLEEGEAP